jgi:hypothetical protein
VRAWSLLAVLILGCKPAAAPLRFDEIALSLDPDPGNVSFGSSSGGDKQGYGYTFDDEPLSAAQQDPNADISMRRPPQTEGQWKCPPSSRCEMQATLELHKEKLLPCYEMAKLPPGGALRFVARLTVNGGGIVEAADVRELSAGGGDVADCLRGGFRDMPFPNEVREDTVDLTIPVRLVRRAPKSP